MDDVAYLLHSSADVFREALVVAQLVEEIITADDSEPPS